MSRSRVLAVALAAGAVLGMLGPAAAAAATPAVVEPGCVVRDATLSWGFKESFRAYIASDIANGEWTTTGGATYETPEFGWSNGSGRYDPVTGEGFVQFLGTVEFTGHGGVLDTTIADPALSITPDGAFLLLDVSGPSMEGDQIDAQDVSFVELTDVSTASNELRVSLDSPTVLTHDGESAFPDYQAGVAFDPVELTLDLDLCSPAYSGGDDLPPSAPGLALVGLYSIPLVLLVAAILGVVFVVRRARA
ncbi:MAG TPA: HtaA domain-containing protein [Pseudolysinimonas sp.]